MENSPVLARAAAHAIAYLKTRDSLPIATTASIDELQQRLRLPLPDDGVPCEQVIDELVQGVDGGILGSSSGRFFGWVIGGALPAAIAADWLTSTWDQNAAAVACSPAEAVIEEVCGVWLKELLGLPSQASFGLVTGCQMAHTTALAAARNRLLTRAGWDVETKGLSGAPPLRLLAGKHRHETILRAARLLGLGTESIRTLPCNNESQIRVDALAIELLREPETPTIICVQAGDLNAGAFDLFPAICAVARETNSWVHVDGAFGLWAAASERFQHLTRGVELADSWATDGHKWLNVPFDSGFVFVADAQAHRAAFSEQTDYEIPVHGVRTQKDWNPEWSRRGRGFAVYAAIKSLGRSGITAMVERCCDHAHRLVMTLGKRADVEVLVEPQINQGLVRFLSPDGDHDRYTDTIINAIQAKGVAWFGGTQWNGMRVMRISVCNWQTNDDDIDKTLTSIEDVLGEVRVEPLTSHFGAAE